MDHPATPTILLIDDDPTILAFTDEFLRDEGYRVLGSVDENW